MRVSGCGPCFLLIWKLPSSGHELSDRWTRAVTVPLLGGQALLLLHKGLEEVAKTLELLSYCPRGLGATVQIILLKMFKATDHVQPGTVNVGS